MKKTNKILLTIGSISSISALPLIAASCKNKEQEQKEKEKKEQIERVTSQVKELWNKDFKGKLNSAKNYSLITEMLQEKFEKEEDKKLISLANSSDARKRPIKNQSNQKIKIKVDSNEIEFDLGDVAEGRQATKYIDPITKTEKETFEKDFSEKEELKNVKKIVQIGYYEHKDNHDGDKLHIRAVSMPTTVEEVPTELPKEITSTRSMFWDAAKFNQDISGWDTSNLETIDQMFIGAKMFNQDLSKWNVSNVRILDYAFSETEAFNQDLSKWDISNVTSMGRVFQKAKVFNNGNKPLLWGNKTKKVKNMNSLFAHAFKFNQDISGWDVSSVTDMEQLFLSAHKFNQPLNTWNVKNVTKMRNMFYDAKTFNQPLDKWNTSNVTDMGNMFYDAQKFNQDISKWDTKNVNKPWDAFAHNNNNWKKEYKPAKWIKYANSKKIKE
ncbi:BspA family leucine-rich repeat surface protein [Metamycoplasma alkalescens]|uniref:BspA family leucine-rich repeat surface protein n=1 Tax=Metamycoplasma alkalescens TaxID=45363 RepID=UPI003D014905